MKNLIACLSLAVFCFLSTTTFSQTTFTGAISTDWAAAGNWDNGLPAPGNDATIPVGLYVVNFGFLSVDFTITNYGAITNFGTINNDGGIVNVGTIINAGTIDNSGIIVNVGSFHNGSATINQCGIWLGIDPLFDPYTTDNCPVLGCIDTTACNYDSAANSDDGSCVQPIWWAGDQDNDGYLTVDNNTGSIYVNVESWPNIGEATITINGTDYPMDYADWGNNAHWYYEIDPSANEDYEWSVAVSNDCANSETVTGSFSTDCEETLNGSATEGCTDSTACNYDSTAACDDGSCEYISCNSGCTYASATNYDSTVLVDDGSCVFECPDITSDNQAVYDGAFADGVASVPENTCPEDLDNDGAVNIQDVLLFLAAYGNLCE